MTKKSATTQLLVYGLDEAGKPKGARFPATEIDTVSPVATALKLQSCRSCSEEVASLGMKLTVGRIYARGKAFIPNIKRELYDKLPVSPVKSHPLQNFSAVASGLFQ